MRTWDINTRQLRTFIAVVECKGVSRAAEHLHVTQPAVSKIVRGIEQSLGSRLFERHGRRLTLTAAGEVFYRHARAAAAELSAGAAEFDALREDKAELVRVHAIPMAMPVFLPRAIARLMDRRPGVQVVLNGDAYYGIADILPAVVKGDADLGITVYQEELGLGLLHAEELFAARLSVVARSDHPFAARAVVKIADLMDQVVVLPPLDDLAGRILVQEFSAVGLPFPPRRIIVANREVAFGLVRECHAIAFLTGHPVCGNRYSDGFINLPIPFRQPIPWKVSVCRRTSSVLSPATTDFLECLRELVREADTLEPLPSMPASPSQYAL